MYEEYGIKHIVFLIQAKVESFTLNILVNVFYIMTLFDYNVLYKSDLVRNSETDINSIRFDIYFLSHDPMSYMYNRPCQIVPNYSFKS